MDPELEPATFQADFVADQWRPECFETSLTLWNGDTFAATKVCGVWYVVYDHQAGSECEFIVCQYGAGVDDCGEPFSGVWGSTSGPTYQQRRSTLSFARFLAREFRGGPWDHIKEPMGDRFDKWLRESHGELTGTGLDPDEIKRNTVWAS